MSFALGDQLCPLHSCSLGSVFTSLTHQNGGLAWRLLVVLLLKPKSCAPESQASWLLWEMRTGVGQGWTHKCCQFMQRLIVKSLEFSLVSLGSHCKVLSKDVTRFLIYIKKIIFDVRQWIGKGPRGEVQANLDTCDLGER